MPRPTTLSWIVRYVDAIGALATRTFQTEEAALAFMERQHALGHDVRSWAEVRTTDLKLPELRRED